MRPVFSTLPPACFGKAKRTSRVCTTTATLTAGGIRNEAHGELDYRGTENGGECAGSNCDTWHYVLAVNEAGYCGYQDWRLPAKDELFSISDLRKAANPPTQDTTVFVWSQPAEYWSANDYSFQWDAAWAWNFEFGHDRVDWKKTPKFVRLVRGSAESLPEVKE